MKWDRFEDFQQSSLKIPNFQKRFLDAFRVWIIFPEVNCENLVTRSNGYGVKGSAVSSLIGYLRTKPPKILAKMLSKFKKNNVQFNTFWGKTKAICWVWSLNKSLKTKNSNRRIVLIHEFDKKLLKGICEKAKWIRESWFADRQFEPWYGYISSYLPKLNSGLELVSETHFHEMSDFE